MPRYTIDERASRSARDVRRIVPRRPTTTAET